jgi:undecaprenyl-diphosphatase
MPGARSRQGPLAPVAFPGEMTMGEGIANRIQYKHYTAARRLMSISRQNLGKMEAPMFVDLFRNLDNGAYNFFDFQSKNVPALVAGMQVGDWVSGIFVPAILVLAAAGIFLTRHRNVAALLSLAAFLLGVIFVEILPMLVAAHRPEGTQYRLDAAEMLRSFPARGVFLVTLAAVLVAFAAADVVRRPAPRILIFAGLLVLTVWVAMSQLMLRLHFVTDVMAGLAGGLALGLLATRFFPATNPAPAAVRSAR